MSQPNSAPAEGGEAKKDVLYDRDAVKDKIGEKLAEIHAGEPEGEEAPPQPEADPTPKQPDPEPEPQAEAPSQSPATPEKAPETETPQLPANLMRSAKAYQWTDDGIKDVFESMGEKGALAFFSNIHEQRNQQTREWAKLGQQKKEIEQQQAQQAPHRRPADPVAMPTQEELETASTATKQFYQGLAEESGNPQLADQFRKAVDEEVDKRLKPLQEQMEMTSQHIQQQRQQQVAAQIDSFFSDPAMKGYTELYGTDRASCTEEQRSNRDKVVEQASYIYRGAAEHDKVLDLSQALYDAHTLLSSEYSKTAARKELEDQVKSRSQGRVEQPRGSETKNPTPTTKDGYRQQALDVIGKKLAEINSS